MRMTAEEFIGLVRRQGIKCLVRNGQLELTGTNGELLNRLRVLLRGNPELAQGVKEHIEGVSLMSVAEYVRECENAGIVLKIDAWSYDIDMAGGNEKARARLRSILDKSPALKARVVLFEARKTPALMDIIQERASLRWAEGYSDSLTSAVLCNYTETGEEIEKDNDRQIIQKARTDWNAELASL